MKPKAKRKGLGLELRTFSGKSGTSYLVFRTRVGSFHMFEEVEAKGAAQDCGAQRENNTRFMWNKLWKKSS